MPAQCDVRHRFDIKDQRVHDLDLDLGLDLRLALDVARRRRLAGARSICDRHHQSGLIGQRDVSLADTHASRTCSPRAE